MYENFCPKCDTLVEHQGWDDYPTYNIICPHCNATLALEWEEEWISDECHGWFYFTINKD